MKKIFFLLFLPIFLNAQTAEEYLLKGVKAIEAENYEEAEKLFNKSIELKSDSGVGHMSKGIANIYLRNFNQAMIDLENSVKYLNDGKSKSEALLFMAQIVRWEFEEPEKSLIYTQRAIEEDPLNFEAYEIHALTLDLLERNVEAIEYFNKAIELSPKDPNLYYNRAISKRKLRRIPEAINDYSKAIEVDSTHFKAYNNRGLLKIQLEDYEGALNDYNESAKYSHDPYSINNRGFAKYKLGDLKSAKADCEESLEMDPNNGWAYHNLGLIHYDLGDTEKACKFFKKAVSLGKVDAQLDIQQKCGKQ